MFMASGSQQLRRRQKVLAQELLTSFSGGFCCGSFLTIPLILFISAVISVCNRKNREHLTAKKPLSCVFLLLVDK